MKDRSEWDSLTKDAGHRSGGVLGGTYVRRLLGRGGAKAVATGFVWTPI
jgi:hypothetical protein